MQDDFVGWSIAFGPLLRGFVGVGNGAAQLQVGDPAAVQLPVQGEVPADGVVFPHGPGALDGVWIGRCVHPAQVARHPQGEAQREVLEKALVEQVEPGEGQLLAVIGLVGGHRLRDGLGVFRAGVDHAAGGARLTVSQTESLAHGDLFGVGTGGEGDLPGGFPFSGVDFHHAAAHVAVFHGRDAGNHLYGFDVGRCDVVGIHALDTHAAGGGGVEGSVVGQPHAVHLHGGAEGSVAALSGPPGTQGELFLAGQGVVFRHAAGQQACDVAHVHQLDVVQGGFVDGTGRGGRRVVLLRGDYGALQGEVILGQLEFEIRDVPFENDVPGDTDIAQAGHRDGTFGDRNVPDGETALAVRDGPLLRSCHDHRCKLHRFTAFLLHHAAAQTEFLGRCGEHCKQRQHAYDQGFPHL